VSYRHFFLSADIDQLRSNCTDFREFLRWGRLLKSVGQGQVWLKLYTHIKQFTRKPNKQGSVCIVNSDTSTVFGSTIQQTSHCRDANLDSLQNLYSLHNTCVKERTTMLCNTCISCLAINTALVLPFLLRPFVILLLANLHHFLICSFSFSVYVYCLATIYYSNPLFMMDVSFIIYVFSIYGHVFRKATRA